MTSSDDENGLTLMNTFVPGDRGIEALIDFQLAEMADMASEARNHGWVENELYRTKGEAKLVVLTRFRTAQAQLDWARTERAQRHFKDLQPFVESVTSTAVTPIAEFGERR